MSFNLGITKEDLAKSASGGESTYIGTSGIYDVTILAVTVDQNEHGQTSFGFYVDLGNDNKQMLYGALPMSTYDNKTVLEGNRATFGALCAIAGVPLDTNFEGVEASLPIGKGGATKDVAILEEFEDVEVKMWVKQEYYRKADGSIGENRIIRAFYRADDNASGDEIATDKDFGSRYEKQSKYFTDVKYGEGVTEEDVKEMIDARRSGNKQPANNTTPPSAAKRSKFAK